MNFFSRNDIGDRTGGTFRGNGYWLGHLGQTGLSRRSVIDRINATIGVLWDVYNRNAELPLPYRVPGSVYASISDYSDALWKKYVIPFNDDPQSSYWDQPAEQAMKDGEAAFTKQAFDYDSRVAAQEKAYQAAQAAAKESGQEFVGPQAPEEISVTPGGQQPPKKSNLPLYIGLGVVAIAAIVGATLMSRDPEATSGPVETIPTEGEAQ